jgi:hypothetical protein
VPVTRLGEVHAAPVLEIANIATLPLDELRSAWQTTLPTLFGGVLEAAAQDDCIQNAGRST